jgi:hypothetical protein
MTRKDTISTLAELGESFHHVEKQKGMKYVDVAIVYHAVGSRNSLKQIISLFTTFKRRVVHIVLRAPD